MAPPRRRHSFKSGPSSGSSGSGSPRSPVDSTSPPMRVGKYDLGNLCKLWDDDPKIRARVRDKHHLIQHYDEINEVATDADVDKTLPNCVLNDTALIPVLDLMRQNDLKLPALDRLIQSVDWFYQTSKASMSLEHCYKQAWAIRDLIQVLKHLLNRDSPPTDSQL